MKPSKEKYKTEYPHLLYTYFVTYDDTFGAPSFSKFARSIGATVRDIERFRTHAKFDEAYRECNEIRRDYLIDAALTRRHDPSFSKFLLTVEYGMGEKEKEEDGELNVTLEVISNGEA